MMRSSTQLSHKLHQRFELFCTSARLKVTHPMGTSPPAPAPRVSLLVLAVFFIFAEIGEGQSLTGALVGTVKDQQGAVVPGALVRVTSAALIGGPIAVTTNEKGQLRLPVLL